MLVVKGHRVVSRGRVAPRAVFVQGGRISAVERHDAPIPPDARVIDAGELAVLPGVVDTHVHINEPGRTSWEGFESATRSAASGGITTLVDMPLNSIPPTTTGEGLAAKIRASEGKLFVDVGFVGGVVPGNEGELSKLVRGGVLAFKCFLTESGVDEFAKVGEPDLRIAMRTLADLGSPLLVHAELDGPLAAAAALLPKDADPRRYQTYLASRPKSAEDEAVSFLVKLAGELRARAHVVHLSSADALSILLDAKDRGVAVSAETCPHYLHFAAEDIEDGRTDHKCAPPIRERANRELLWNALADGLLDQVVSDHSPCVPELKRLESGSFSEAWGGIASLGLGVSVVWTEASRRGLPLERVVEWMCRAPARLVGLESVKGDIAPGLDADLVVFDPERRFEVDTARLFHRNKVSPYRGETLSGVVEMTMLRGQEIFSRGAFTAPPSGRVLRLEDR